MKSKFAYIDESGTPILSDSKFYVITAAICNSDEHDNIEKGIKAIQDNRCSGAQLKSSRIGGNKKLRKQILSDLSNLQLYYFSCVIEKSKINPDSGLQWRTSMYKYCQRLLFDRIYKNLQSIRVVADTYGRSEFKTSFESYIDNYFPNTLFSTKEFKYSTPDEDILIQASDFVGGSIYRCYEGNDNRNDTLELIKERIVGIRKWPLSLEETCYGDDEEIIDMMIKNHCFLVASEFIDTTNDELLKEVCSFLLYDYSAIDKDFIFGDELLSKLKLQGIIAEEKQKQWFMQQVIAPLRDAGVLIAASRDGYKIPDCREDVAKFVKFVESKSYPYLSRLVRMRESIFLGTDTKYDLIVESEKLSNILKSIH